MWTVPYSVELYFNEYDYQIKIIYLNGFNLLEHLLHGEILYSFHLLSVCLIIDFDLLTILFAYGEPYIYFVLLPMMLDNVAYFLSLISILLDGSYYNV